MTVRLLQSFKELKVRDDGEWVEKLGVTLSSYRGMKVGLIR